MLPYNGDKGKPASFRLSKGSPISIRFRPLLVLLGLILLFFVWNSRKSSTGLTDYPTTVGQTTAPLKGKKKLLLGGYPNPASVRNTDPLHRLSEMDFRLTKEDWDAATKPLDVTKEFKDLGQRLRLFFEKWRRWESLSRWLLVEGVERVEGMGLGSTVIDEFRNYIGQFEQLLFPWLKPYHTSLLSLKSELYESGRGIVLAVGNNHVKLATFVIKSIRALGCTLPIEVWHIGDGDLRKEGQEQLYALGGVAVRDITRVFDQDIVGLRGWDVKPFSILASRFREVVFIDADAVFLKNPDLLFEDPVYKETGTLFYYDRRTLFGGDDEHLNFVKTLVPDPPSPTLLRNGMYMKKTVHFQESGVVVIDKLRHLEGLLGTCKMNEREAREKVTYKIFHGDKETFWSGFEMAGDARYGFSPHSAGAIGMLLDGDVDPYKALRGELGEKTVDMTTGGDFAAKPGKRVCSLQLAHPDAYGKAIFWFNGGILRDKFLGDSSPIGDFQVWSLEPGKWELYKDNICCLYLEEEWEMERVYKVSQEDRKTIDMLGKIWFEVTK